MGGEVQGVPAGAAVEESSAPTELGAWLRQQRELRGISLFFVAARTKLSAERILSLESGERPLPDDGQGRATARVLARAMGADPDEATAILSGARQIGRRPGPGARRAAASPLGGWGRWLVSASFLALGAWLLVAWLGASSGADDSGVVYRTDYVNELLEDDGS